MKRSLYLPEAEAEVASQFDFYRERSASAAMGFLEAVDSALMLACELPEAAPHLARRYRARVLGKPFMYRLVYRLEGDVVIVAAVWADRRDSTELFARLRSIDDEADD